MRPDWEDYWFGMAAQVATRATCPRASIGVVLVKANRIVSCGYNGNPPGVSHCPTEGEPLAEHMALLHCPTAIHGEKNAVVNAVGNVFGATAYVVGDRRVCLDCDALLRSVGVTDIRHRYGVPSLDTLARDIRAWQAETFPHATPASVAEHLRREAEELAYEPTNPEEIADIFHLLVAAAETNGYDLVGAVSTKFAINRARTWGRPDAAGVVEHLREAT